jgi:hypothetical protein
MSAYVHVDVVLEQEGEFVGSDGVERAVVLVGKIVIDETDARRLASHYKDRTDAGALPLADESRELAVPIMQALVDAGLADAG